MPTLDLNNTFGAFFIGVVVSSALFGVTCTQVFYFFQNYPSDPILVKGVVIMLLMCEALHSALAIHATYHYTILNYMNPKALLTATWSAILTIVISAIIMLVVHIFYARRVYYISRRNIPLVALITALALVHFATSTAVAVRAFQLQFFKGFLTISGLVESGLASAAVADTLIAGSLSWYLHRSRSGLKSTDTLINRLMAYAINNGILTSVFDILVVAFEAREPNNLIFLSIFQVVGNLYTNSMMATLNSRKYIHQNVPADSTTPMTTFRIASATAIAEEHSQHTNGTKNHIEITSTRESDVV